MKILSAQLSDFIRLTEITFQSKSYWGYSAEQMEKWKEDLTISQDYIREKEVFVLKKDKEIIGYYSFYHVKPSTIKLDNLFLAPEFIGKGLGKLLMKDFLEHCKLLSVNTITLDSEPFATDFYLKQGFQIVNQQESSVPGRFLPVMELII